VFLELDELANSNADALDGHSDEGVQVARVQRRESQVLWKHYVLNFCGSLASAGGGSAGVDDMLACKARHQALRRRELSGQNP